MDLSSLSRARRAWRRRAFPAFCAAVITCAAGAAPASAGEPLVPYIIGGQQASVSQFPWQVFIQGTIESGSAKLGGLDPRRLPHPYGGALRRSRRHDVTHPAADYEVLAGRSNLAEIGPTDQLRNVAHPNSSLLRPRR